MGSASLPTTSLAVAARYLREAHGHQEAMVGIVANAGRTHSALLTRAPLGTIVATLAPGFKVVRFGLGWAAFYPHPRHEAQDCNALTDALTPSNGTRVAREARERLRRH